VSDRAQRAGVPPATYARQVLLEDPALTADAAPFLTRALRTLRELAASARAADDVVNQRRFEAAHFELAQLSQRLVSEAGIAPRDTSR
jgi:uncharacterized protein YjiS (DUF1127 family)